MNSSYETASSMKAIAMTDFPKIGRVADQLEMIDALVPRPASDEVAIQLVASSIHIDEIYAAQGTALGRFFGPKQVSKTDPYLMGSSVSGIIVGLGEDAKTFRLGEEVIVIPNETGEIASWATYRCVAQKMVMVKPPELTHLEAAAITMASCVALGAIEVSKANKSSRCLVVGASGAVGSMTLQFLKTLGCHVTAVCSGANEELVRAKGADEMIDYTQENFGDLGRFANGLYDIVFDCVGGREIETDAFRALKKSGRFITVVGPLRHIGERRLSWFELTRVMVHMLRRIVRTRLSRPRYIFGMKYPRKTIVRAMELIVKHNLRIPLHAILPFELEAVKSAIREISTHRSKGRIVISFKDVNDINYIPR